VLLDSGFRRNDGFWTFDESIKLNVHNCPCENMVAQLVDIEREDSIFMQRALEAKIAYRE
jgi:hypothetical protein